ncbi:MAG: NfeD family protein [Synechococcales bacterium]|nr:NfeD family protein [Synechococcales bacterium]
MEFTLPTAFLEFTMGLSAILVGILALVVPSFGVQVAVWLLLSVVFLVLARRLMPKAVPAMIRDSQEARTLTAIPAGKTGRVIYEGASWQARCDDDQVAIAPEELVYVVSRRGNTLVVVPERLLHS